MKSANVSIPNWYYQNKFGYYKLNMRFGFSLSISAKIKSSWVNKDSIESLYQFRDISILMILHILFHLFRSLKLIYQYFIVYNIQVFCYFLKFDACFIFFCVIANTIFFLILLLYYSLLVHKIQFIFILIMYLETFLY